jgi:hypothetical protein
MRTLARVLLAVLILLGTAAAIAVYVAPDRAREAWRSLQARVEAWSTRSVEPGGSDGAPRTVPTNVNADPRRSLPSPASSGKPLVQPASARKESAVRPATATGEPDRQPIAAPNVLIAQLPPQAKAKADPSPSDAPPAAAQGDGPFQFPADAAGRLLADRLTPPRDVPLAPTPFVREPRPRSASMLDELKPHVAPLPPAGPGAAAVVIGDERRPPQRGQPAFDRPPLAAEADPQRPQRALWPAAPLAYAPSANSEATPALKYVGLPVADTVTAQDDPTADSARTALLAGTSVPPPVPPRPLRLAIPDPFENARVVQLVNPPAERDPPEPSFQRPQPPLLPVPEPKKKQ